MGEEELHQLIGGCIKQERGSQKMLYKAFYGFSMGICLRYANNREEAAEVMNQGFYKVFTRIETYDTSRPFKAWLGKIMMNVSIDYYRANLKMAYTEDLDSAEYVTDGELADRTLNYDDLLAMIQKLPNAYRTVFNLFAVEGYSHEEIGEMLNISSGTSKSNLHKARSTLVPPTSPARIIVRSPACPRHLPQAVVMRQRQRCRAEGLCDGRQA